MARNRMINPGIWASEDFSKLSMFARLVWIGLISNADDEGRGRANMAFLKSQIFPFDDELSLKKIENALQEIKNFMKIDFYEVDGKKFYQLNNWKKFQKVEKPSPSQIPINPENTNGSQIKFGEHSGNGRGIVTENSPGVHGVIGEESVPKKEIEKEIYINKENSLTRVKENGERVPFGEFKNVLLTEEEHSQILADPIGEQAIEFYSRYKQRKDYKCKNDFLAICDWVFTALKEKLQRESKLEKKDFVKRNYSREYLNSLFQDINEIEI